MENEQDFYSGLVDYLQMSGAGPGARYLQFRLIDAGKASPNFLIRGDTMHAAFVGFVTVVASAQASQTAIRVYAPDAQEGTGNRWVNFIDSPYLSDRASLAVPDFAITASDCARCGEK